MMGMLDRKLIRDLWRLKAQALAISLVIASGVATLVLGVGAHRSLFETRNTYYDRYNFADVFASLKRAPNSLRQRVAEIPGVRAVDTRIETTAINDIEGVIEPVNAIALSLPDHHAPVLNRLYLKSGRLPEAGHPRETVVNEAFAKANRLEIGNRFSGTMQGVRRTFEIVGIALSPEFIYAIGPGDLMPDDRRFAVMWMSEKTLAAALDIEGAFNSISLKLTRTASEPEVIRQLDRLLERYGGTGAYGRKDQLSHAFIDAELSQLQAMSRVIPPIFLAVSAFLINITLARLIALEREQIGLLKAIGYGSFAVGWHYMKLALVIALVGIVIGTIAGTWLGRGLTRLYADFFHFPFLVFRRDADVYVIAIGISAAAAAAGAARAVWSVLTLAPAVAMQPPAPPRYRRSLVERMGVLRIFSQLTVMSLRHMLRYPLRSMFTVVGIALAEALLVTALFTLDSVEHMIDVTFFRMDRQIASVAFVDERHPRVMESVERLPGVLRAEPFRAASVRIRKEHRSRRLEILGKPENMELSRVLDLDLKPISLPSEGLVVSERVAQLLHIRRGDIVEVEMLEGSRRKLRIPVSDIIQSFLGLSVFMDKDALDRVVDDGGRISGAHLNIDQSQLPELYKKVKETPQIASVALQRVSLKKFRETIAQNINIMITVYVSLSIIIALGVVYNSARIQLSERARELASLRVLGFTRAEVSRVLLMELAIMVLLALPLGAVIGYFFAWLVIQGFASDLYRVPFIVNDTTFAIASLVVLATSIVSGLIVRGRIDRFNLVSVLKTRE